MIHPQGNAFCGEFSPLASQARLFDVAFWHFSDVASLIDDVGSWGRSGPLGCERRLPEMTHFRHSMRRLSLMVLRNSHPDVTRFSAALSMIEII
jgi:hypothetical protein